MTTGPERSRSFGQVAAALHRTDPGTRWSIVESLLTPGGTFASFGGQLALTDPAVADAVRRARAPFVEEDTFGSPDGTTDEDALRWPGTELSTRPGLQDVRQRVIGRRTTLSADEYVAHLATISAYLVLAPADLQEVLARVRAMLPERVSITGTSRCTWHDDGNQPTRAPCRLPGSPRQSSSYSRSASSIRPSSAATASGLPWKSR